MVNYQIQKNRNFFVQAQYESLNNQKGINDHYAHYIFF